MELNLRPFISILSIAIGCIFSFSNAISQTNDNIIYNHTEQMPIFSRHPDYTKTIISYNLKYPASALRDSIQGTVTVGFTVTKSGTLKDIKVLKSVAPALDSEAVRVVGQMRKWLPVKHNGEKVNVSTSLPITFNIADYKAAKQPFQPSIDVIGTNIPTGNGLPSPGCNVNQFLKDNIKYPKDAYRDNVEGIVKVAFTINEDGSITYPTISETLGRPSLDSEAIRVVRMMPNWNPALQGRKPVKVGYILPVSFTINK